MMALTSASEVTVLGIPAGPEVVPLRAAGLLEAVTLSTAAAAEQQLAATLLTTKFVYVYDYLSQALVFVSAGVEQLLGERPAATALTLDWFARRLHPDDAPAVAQAQALVGEYLRTRTAALLPNFLFSLDYRLRHANGHYRRVLHECLLLEREPGPGAIRRTLSLFTDLTWHKLTHEVRFHVNQPDFAPFAARQQPAASRLSARERQVLALVLQGLTSRQIAYHLKLSEGTIKAHRRNLLRKAATHSFHELLSHLDPPTKIKVATASLARPRPPRGGAAGGRGHASLPRA